MTENPLPKVEKQAMIERSPSWLLTPEGQAALRVGAEAQRNADWELVGKLVEEVKSICSSLPFKDGSGYTQCRVCRWVAHFGHSPTCPVPVLSRALAALSEQKP